ncbi:hypothetical protein HGM15179_015407 [Zosterops borbonicus]|uniref:Uncharacterized protein n=1 Tax=Zosterops borbonicus TaxID=364589 RepID=A0A8K1G562_9PASS|nr:hypothetical protein HGM15179_015407 [Zosterops borbonicus]
MIEETSDENTKKSEAYEVTDEQDVEENYPNGAVKEWLLLAKGNIFLQRSDIVLYNICGTGIESLEDIEFNRLQISPGLQNVLVDVITEVFPTSVIGPAACPSSEPSEIGSVGHGHSFQQLLTEATPVALPYQHTRAMVESLSLEEFSRHVDVALGQIG